MLTINNTLDGYLKDVEIKGNTVQDTNNLADIRSVGDTVEGQELYEIPVLSCGKNLLKLNSSETYYGVTLNWENNVLSANGTGTVSILKDYKINHLVEKGKTYILKSNNSSVGIMNSGSVIGINNSFVASDNVSIYFQVIKDKVFNEKIELQLEEGKVATPYEPYVEDKLTILSPVQLEKVGNVADRIICKDGVWGVEKNIIDTIITGNESGVNLTTGADGVKKYFNLVKPGNIYNIKSGIQYYHITNKLQNGNPYNGVDNSFWLFYDGSNTQLRIRLDDSYTTKEQYIEWIKSNNILVKYITTQPQFIPLPHDQQIKLRTFANKTNISFLTEIEGTIKAQVPKSLGATVNTHTKQISNLNKELDRVKKLEESTVSTVETESDFTTVEATSNGYFEDVKLEGKTLVNLLVREPSTIYVNSTSLSCSYSNKTITNGTFTIVNNANKNIIYGIYLVTTGNWSRNVVVSKNSSLKVVLNSNEYIGNMVGDFSQGFANTSEGKEEFTKGRLILEGDHTQNPPSYFEGLKSVSDGVDEVSVESVNENLIPNIKFKKGGTDTPPYNNLTLDNARYRSLGDFIFLPKGEYCINANQSVSSQSIAFKVKDMFGKDIIGVTDTPFTFSNPINQYVYIFGRKGGGEWDLGEYPSDIGLTLTKGKDLKSYTPHQSDKKRLLYYNEETQSWEKPILRQWDSIEKHADGKYYYHQRSGEVVLNGSEDWMLDKNNKTVLAMKSIKVYGKDGDLVISTINSHLPNFTGSKLWVEDVEGVGLANTGGIKVNVAKSKLSTQDVQGFKQWLQANNVTVVYQLAQEKVYECTNIDLITYSGETNYVVESGAIVPKTTLKVHNNISNVVRILQEKVSLLEDKFIQGLKQVLAGDMYSLAELLYPEDFVEVETENDIMLLPLE